MPLRTTTAKALAQIERRDPQGARQYRAELRYFHVPGRTILGMSTTCAIFDEALAFQRMAKIVDGAVEKARQAAPTAFALAPPVAP